MAVNVLAIGRHDSALKQIERALKLRKFKVTGCKSDDDALSKIKNQHFDALLLASEIKLESKAIFKQFTREQRPGLPVIEINGTTDHLAEEIEAALLDVRIT